MYSRGKVLATAITAVAFLSFAVASASAGRLSVDDRDFRIVANPTITTDGGSTIRCAVTLAGSYHGSTFAKTARSLIGVISSARAESRCAEGRLTLLEGTLPWHITYDSFAGTLPRITRTNLRITGFAGQFESSGVTCLFATDIIDPLPMLFDYSFPVFILMSFHGGPIDLATTGFLCELAGDVEFSGSERNVEDGGGALIAISLI